MLKNKCGQRRTKLYRKNTTFLHFFNIRFLPFLHFDFINCSREYLRAIRNRQYE